MPCYMKIHIFNILEMKEPKMEDKTILIWFALIALSILGGAHGGIPGAGAAVLGLTALYIVGVIIYVAVTSISRLVREEFELWFK